MTVKYQTLEIKRDAAWDHFVKSQTGKNWQLFVKADRLMKTEWRLNNDI